MEKFLKEYGKYAVLGLMTIKSGIERDIEELTSQINKANGDLPKGVNAPPRKKRVLSAAARKRIGAAQTKRWAAHRKAKGSK